MNPFHRRLIAALLLATTALAAITPSAFAGHGRDSYRKVRRIEHRGRVECVNVYPQQVVGYRHHRSGGGSTLAGFLGGIAVGAILSNATQVHASNRVVCAPQPAYCPPPSRCDADAGRYSYVDPYCSERYSSLEIYLSHARRHCSHAIVAQVIDNREDECIDVVRFGGDHWRSCDRDDRGGWDYDND